MPRTYEIHLFGPDGLQSFEPALCDSVAQAIEKARAILHATMADRAELRFAGDLLFTIDR